MTKELYLDRTDSPIGQILIVADPSTAKLYALDYLDYESRMLKLLGQRFGKFNFTEVTNPHGFTKAVQAYFAGQLDALDNLAVDTGGTDFQQKVWQALRTITSGTTVSYGSLATKLGNGGAVRAVGATNGLNPIAIVLPCHRVIGANGALTGYAGGLERKRWLLDHERSYSQLSF